MITVIGTGAGGKNSLSLEAYNIIKNSEKIILKTEKMPVTALLKSENIAYSTLDEKYEQAEDFDSLNLLIKEHLEKQKDCVYLVHGSALDDTSVLLLENTRIVPGISISDCACAFLNKPLNVKAYTAFELLEGVLPSPHNTCTVTCIDSEYIAADIKCILSEIYGDEFEILVYQADFEGNGKKKSIMLYELDTLEDYNHNTTIFLDKVDFSKVFKYDCKHLLEIMDKLCARDGCPWDSSQTHESLRPYLIEEAYEVADTIDKDDPYKLYDELGDVLYQIVFHANIAKRSGEFDFSDVTDAICRKMINRHPSIFSDKAPDGELNDNWEKMKMQEKGLKDTYEVMKDVPEALASLNKCEKLLHKAEKAGIKFDDKQQTINNIVSILNEKKLENEDIIGTLLFETVKLCRQVGIHPELALNRKNNDFIESFHKK